MGDVIPLHNRVGYAYRGYTIAPTGYPPELGAWSYERADRIARGDLQNVWHGTAGTVQAAVEEIDDLEDWRPAARIVEDEPIMLRDLAAVLALSLFVVAVGIWLLAVARGQA